ncbi:MAG: hypothetical protein GWN37_11395 [Gammaproteobacteria bacterium]|nr:hypothetical protein [Gammaproteobacteria bacterium]
MINSKIFCRTLIVISISLFQWSALPSVALAGPSDNVEALELPVPRTVDLAHVEPEHFARALGKDPERIFAFVRDQVAYEVYRGYLRGPRGTLLAMAGNSVDQAALLGSLLEHAGHRARYVRGVLPEAEIQKLVEAMWAAGPPPARTVNEPSPEVAAALETLRNGVERDYNLIRGHLERAGRTAGPEAATRLGSLASEARAHYWVQWWKDGAWVDLDPTFEEAAVDERLAQADEPFESFPEGLYHRVEIVVRLEEYTGDQSSERVILRHSAKAAELSGRDLPLVHLPEHWKGPANSLQDAISASLEDTGRIKPVLLLGNERPEVGKPFRQKRPKQAGLGGLMNMLKGEGTREPVSIATAEWVEFDFVYPGGRKKTVVREIFDRVGPARRARREKLTATEVQAQAGTDDELDLTKAVYDLFFTTGPMAAVHLPNASEVPAASGDEPQDVLAALRQFNLGFVIASDKALRKLDLPGDNVVLFYPDSPRLQITELSNDPARQRFVLDLRRDQARIVMRDPRPTLAFHTRIFRGVVEGTLERTFMDLLLAEWRHKSGGWGPGIGTSSLFERTRAEAVTTVLLDGAHARVPGDGDIPEDALARLYRSLEGGYIAVAPERALAFGAKPRFAWWRIDGKSGETIAVMDDGLHPNGAEREGEVVVVVRPTAGWIYRWRLTYITYTAGVADLTTILVRLLTAPEFQQFLNNVGNNVNVRIILP